MVFYAVLREKLRMVYTNLTAIFIIKFFYEIS